MATATRTGFHVPCPLCGALEGLTIAAHDLSLGCNECGDEVTREDIERLVEDAKRLLRWLDAATEV